MSHSLDPDQDQLFVGPDLVPNCLQRISADEKKSPLTGIKLRKAIKQVSFTVNTGRKSTSHSMTTTVQSHTVR